ncbi:MULTISPECIES: excinuclease ABC subunit UvrC [Protofrankia]|uniref:UvrABC system protein C n=1 Tax=Candidatus Protofrankia datiscae TaxID=2716812 RepID=F8AYY9_9ACTN|nr:MULTISPECIES: excinuclease ABC subunit UvrC [Protofrankia]AEH09577.1 UvrABC system protein C [Candidatus Protofrankia datiscae]
MADPASYRPAPGSVPETPGVYRFFDEHGRVVYVGKAKNLRARLSNYFTDIHNLHPRTQHMVTTASSVDWTVVSTEVEALQLEYTWIKEFDPRFNVRYRDDKSYPSLAVTLYEQFPRLQVMRGAKRPGVRYFGPYAHAWAIRETLDLLLRVFPARTCSTGVFKQAARIGRPCLLGYIDRCSAPCVGRVDAAEHRRIVEDFCDFMSGQTGRYIRRLEREMGEAAAEQRYEQAARLRDDIGALRRAMEKQAVVLPDGTDADVVAFAQDELEAAVQIFYVRDGRVRGQRGWVVDKIEDLTTGELVEQFLTQEYLSDSTGASPASAGASAPSAGAGRVGTGVTNEIPREVLVPQLPPDTEVVADLLGIARGGRVDLRVPRRGDKRTLMETVEHNARQAFALHRMRRASDISARSRALSELSDALGLADPPLRIESFDISNLQGTEVVASMVVFEDGLPRKSEYRRFAIRGVDGQDDVASMHETITRRFSRYLAEKARTGEFAGLPDLADPVGGADAPDPSDPSGAPAPPGSPEAATPARPAAGAGSPGTAPGAASAALDPTTGRPRRFAYPPNLVVVDGGPPQVAAARRALDALGIDSGPGGVALCGLAKRLEEVWLPDEEDPVILPRTSEALYLLQRIRDEAHRFAITYHRQKRSKSMVRSALDDIPGLGETRRKALLRAFGSLARIRQATVEQIAEVPGIGRHTARAIVDALAPTSPGGADATPGAVDPYTGEILDSADAPPSVTQAGTPAPSTTARATAPDPGPDATQTRGVPT